MVTAPQIRGYRDLTLISAKGGQAHVYRAHKATMDGSPVAIKVYKQDLDDADRRRFLREVQALQALRGRPHVVRLLEADFTGDGAGYVVMDLYAASVADRLAGGATLPAAEVLRIGAQVAEALMHAHEAATRILHRDIKPSNILLTDDGGAVLTDFGISAISRTDGAYTATARIGTRGYMAPEVHAGHADSVASDLYSLGATLHTLLLGEPPSAFAPAGALPTVPEPLASVLRRALSPDPAQRPESARRLREELLQAAVRETGAFASPPPAATRVMPEEPAAPAEVRPRLLEAPAVDPDLGRTIAGGLGGMLAGLGLLTLVGWPWWAGALLVAVPLGAAVALRAVLHTRRLAGPAAAVALACYAVPVVGYASGLGERPFVNLGLLALVLLAFGGQVVATHQIERYVRQDLAQAAVARENLERRQVFASFGGRYWLDGADPPDWLDDVLGALPAARAMPWRDGLVRHAVVCDRSVVLVTVLGGARPGTYDLAPAGGHPCRVFADGRPNTSVDIRLRDLAGRVDGVGWGATGAAAGCVVVLTTDGNRSDGIRLAPAQFDSTGVTVVVARDVAAAVVRLLAGADPQVIDPVLLRAVHERAARA